MVSPELLVELERATIFPRSPTATHFDGISSIIQSPPNFGSVAGVPGSPMRECLPPVLVS